MKKGSPFGTFTIIFLFAVSILVTRCERERIPEDRLDDGIERTPEDRLDGALLEAARDGRPLNAKRLLERGANINARDDEHGATALIYAGGNRHIKVVRLLIENGADVNLQDKSGRTALMGGADYPEIVEILLNNGADVNARDQWEWTALMLLMMVDEVITDPNWDERYASAELLIGNGADVNVLDEFGCTALDYAFHPKMAQLLREAFANTGKECFALVF